MKRKHVSVACVACRRSKTKCTGQNPCESCYRHDIRCEYDLIRDDGRSKEARKRKVAEVEHDSDLLNELIETVQASSDEGIAQIMTLIRSNAPIEDVKVSVKQHIAHVRQSRREGSPELEHFIAQIEKDDRPKRKALDISLLVEPPPISVPASPWTDVTDDDFLVSDLVSSWMTWDQYFYNWLDEDNFLRDMQSGSLHATYCSPFLVNAMLALACTYSDDFEAKTQKGKLSKLAGNFLDEAQRLFSIDSSPSLTNIQGLGYYYVAVCVHGQDGLGYELIQRAVTMCESLIRQHKDPHTSLTAVEQKTCGGIFNLYAISMMAWQRSMQFSAPKVSSKQPISKKSDWVPYPLSGDSVTSYSNELFEQHSALVAIAYEISMMWEQVLPIPLEERGERLLEEKVLTLYQRLFDWNRDLPEHLRPRDGSPPSVITHLSFYWKPIQTLSTIVLHTLRNASIETRKQAETWNIKAALEIESLCKYHQASFGNAHMSLYMIHPVLHSLFTLTEAGNASAYSTTITNLCVFCRAMARRWPFCMAAFRMYQVQMHEKGIKLPVETDKLFEDFENSQWSNVELERLKTIYPVPSDMGSEKRNMGDFLKAMDRLNIGQE